MWAMPQRPSCIRPWIGSWNAKAASSGNWPSVTFRREASSSTMSAAVTTKAAPAPWLITATIETAKRGCQSSSTGCSRTGCGRPVAVDVYPGNTADSKTIPDQIVKVREKFSFTRVILVGDRGMLTQTQIDTLRAVSRPGLDFCFAVEAIGKLIEEGAVHGKLFKSVTLAEVDFAGLPWRTLDRLLQRAVGQGTQRETPETCWRRRRPI